MELLSAAWASLGGASTALDAVQIVNGGSLPSVFRVSDLATASVGCAALAVAELAALRSGALAPVQVDHRLASLWFGCSVRPQAWALPAAWDPIAGDYPAQDGWIRLHTNAPRHRAAALAVLGAQDGTPAASSRERVAAAVAGWRAEDLEQAVVAAGGCAAAMRDVQAWAGHPQGAAVAAEPLVHVTTHALARPRADARVGESPSAPLAGLRVLDMTRVLAGPTATRFLAGWGADVLRVDPPDWDEPAVLPDVMLGKRSVRMDLRLAAERQRWLALLAQADVLVHGYRPGALDALGLDAAIRRRFAPALIEVSLDAYGWQGPWRQRRGFDSLVQMSSGIAAAGMAWRRSDRPQPLPVQALDHATGYLMAAAAVRGLTRLWREGLPSSWWLSLARTAHSLVQAGPNADTGPWAPLDDADLAPGTELTSWGPAQRLHAPVRIGQAGPRWTIAAGALGRDEAAWRGPAGSAREAKGDVSGGA